MEAGGGEEWGRRGQPAERVVCSHLGGLDHLAAARELNATRNGKLETARGL